VKQDIRANWSHAILVCRKCSRKQAKSGHGFGGKKTSLAKALKKETGAGKGRKARLGIVEVPCLGICPKQGVVLVDTRTPGQWRIVSPDASIEELALELTAVEGG